MEETIAFDEFNFALSPNGIVWVNNANSVGMNAPTSVVVPTLLCPSDGLASPVVSTIWGTFIKSSYLGKFHSDFGKPWVRLLAVSSSTQRTCRERCRLSRRPKVPQTRVRVAIVLFALRLSSIVSIEKFFSGNWPF
jgi:hypothetical protein